MKLYRQKSLHDNGVAALWNLIELIKLNVSGSTLEKVQYNPNYPSLECLSNSLSDWDIENMGVRLSIGQLPEIPYPAIAHLHKNNGHFVVLKNLENDQMHYIDPEVGVVTEPLREFEKKWSGVALLVKEFKIMGNIIDEMRGLQQKFNAIKVSYLEVQVGQKSTVDCNNLGK